MKLHLSHQRSQESKRMLAQRAARSVERVFIQRDQRLESIMRSRERPSQKEILPPGDQWHQWVVKQKTKQDKILKQQREQNEYLEYVKNKKEEKIKSMERYRK